MMECDINGMRKFCFILVATLIHVKMYAVLALPTSKTVIQKDMCQLEIFLRGDEHCHFYYTIDNIPVAESEDGSFYHVLIRDNRIVLSNILAHEKDERNTDESEFIIKHADEVRQFLSHFWAEKMEASNSRRLTRSISNTSKNTLGESKKYKGEKKGLVILVNFANKSMSMSNAQETFDKMFNEIGYNKNNAVGSVHDYFFDQSYGQFSLTFDVVGPVTVSNNYGYYGSNGTSLNGGDLKVDEMIVEACKLSDNQVNFANYDWDSDGEVDQVYVIYAGYGEASGGPKNTIWPHESHLEYQESGVLTLDGVIINTYACSCELTGGSGTTLNGIGTACHEFSHCLGFPDLYDTGYSGGFGMSYWDIMSSGSHCGPKGHGEVPSGYSAYERQIAGWLELSELNYPCVISDMPSIADEPVAYVIYNDNHRDEYFLLENRQNNNKWFSYVGTYEDCHGLLITHIDYSETAWKNNKVNSMPKHQRMTIIPADMSYGSTYTSEDGSYYNLNKNELQGDLFPGLSNIVELTNTSHYAAGGKLFNLNTDGSFYMNKPLTNISETNGLISFYFMGGIYVPAPEVLDATEITGTSFNANWNPVEGADSYTLELSVMKPQGNPMDNILLSENLAKFKTGRNTADGYADLSDNLNNYMQHNGWTGQKVFTSQHGVKIGTTSTTGYLLSPLLKVNNSDLTIRFTGKAITSAGANIQFVIMTSSGSTLDLQECKLYYQSKQFVVNFEDIDVSDIKIKITSSERIYLSDILFYDGFYVESDFSSYSGTSHLTGVQSTIFENIMSNKLLLSNLTEEIYRYRVKTNMSGTHSGWSSYKEVNIQNKTDIKDVNFDWKEAEFYLYNLDGKKVETSSQPGIYIIRYKTGTSKKIIIK